MANATDLKLERTLRESEERFRMMAESIQDGLTIIENGQVVYMNDRLAQIYGYSKDELAQMDGLELAAPEERERLGRILQAAKEQGQPLEELEFWGVCKDGTRRYVRNRYSMAGDAEGVIRRFVVTSDITEQKRTEQALVEQQQMLQSIMDNIPWSVFWKDRDLVYLGCNQNFADDAGLDSPEVIIGQDDFQMPWLDQAELYRADDQSVMDGGEAKLNYEEPQTTPDGSQIWLRTSKVPLRDAEGEVIGVLGMYEDITERKRLEQEIQTSLERRTEQVRLSTEMAQEIAGAPALEELYQRVVTLVRERFGYYHAQIFQHDADLDAMVVVEGYGLAGAKMKVAGHSLPYGQGVVGTAAATGEPVLAADVTGDPNWVPHPDLPQTKGELAVPIKLRDEVLGVLDVQSDTAGALGEEDQVLLVGLAGQIASAIESTHLAQQSQAALNEARQSEQLMRSILAQTEALYAGSERVVRAETIDQVLQVLVESTALQQLDRVSIAYFDHPWEEEQPEEATIITAWERSGQEPQVPVGTRYRLAQFPAIDAVTARSPVIFRDVMTDDRVGEALRTLMVDRLGMRSLGLWPLVVGGQWVGMLTGQASTPMEIEEGEERQIASLIDQASAVVQSQRLHEQAQHRAIWLQTAAEVSRVAGSILDPDELMQRAVDLVRDSFDLYYVGLFLVDESGDGTGSNGADKSGRWAQLQVGTGEAGRQMVGRGHKLEIGGESMIGQCLVSRQPFVAMDVAGGRRRGQEAVRFDNPLLPDTRTELALPLVSRGQALGALTVQSTQPAAFSDEDIAVLQTMADQLATTINNARLIEGAQSRAEREQRVRAITDRIRRGADAEAIMRITLEELSEMLGASKAVVRLGTRSQLASQPGDGVGSDPVADQ